MPSIRILDAASSFLQNGGKGDTAVATLNIKSFPDGLYKKLRARARAHRRSMAQEVIYLLREATMRESATSILELKGLGKESWKDIDPVAHVAEERRTWD
jgi:plasmid stability protein